MRGGQRRGTGPAVAAPALLVLVLVVVGRGFGDAQAQPVSPLRGTPVPSPLEAGLGQVDIHVSALVERLLDVDDKEYRFESLMYLYFSWTDPRAYPAVDANGTAECRLPCNSAGNDASCCDQVWLPGLDIFNVHLWVPPGWGTVKVKG